MRRLIIALGFAALLAQSVLAWQPAGWVYSDYPWAYDSGSGDWYWFSTADTQWITQMGTGQWSTLPNSALASGWGFFNGSFAYAQANSAWHWINPNDFQWVFNMSIGEWSLFGTLSGMVLIPGGTNSGNIPGYGAYGPYSLTVSSFYMDKYEVTKGLWDEVYSWAVANGYALIKAFRMRHLARQRTILWKGSTGTMP